MHPHFLASLRRGLCQSRRNDSSFVLQCNSEAWSCRHPRGMLCRTPVTACWIRLLQLLHIFGPISSSCQSRPSVFDSPCRSLARKRSTVSPIPLPDHTHCSQVTSVQSRASLTLSTVRCRTLPTPTSHLSTSALLPPAPGPQAVRHTSYTALSPGVYYGRSVLASCSPSRKYGSSRSRRRSGTINGLCSSSRWSCHVRLHPCSSIWMLTWIPSFSRLVAFHNKARGQGCATHLLPLVHNTPPIPTRAASSR